MGIFVNDFNNTQALAMCRCGPGHRGLDIHTDEPRFGFTLLPFCQLAQKRACRGTDFLYDVIIMHKKVRDLANQIMTLSYNGTDSLI